MRFEVVAVLVALCCASASAQVITFGGLSPVSDTSFLRETLENALIQVADEHKVSWTLLEILSAQKQVVAGARYLVDVNLQSADGTKKCTFDIWEQSWVKYLRATVSCQPENKEYTVERGQKAT